MSGALERVIDALEAAGSKANRAGGGRVYQCPAHDDRSPSLSVSAGNTVEVVFNCHAGCERDDILAALGLTWKDILRGGGDSKEYRERRADLWVPCNPKGCGGHKAAEYRYTDETGKLLYAVTRCSRKGDGCPHPFAQWRPDGTKPHGKAWGLPASVRHVIYRLADVIAAARAGKRIYLVEGEKDADRMKVDFPDEVATTIAAGAGSKKWKNEYAKYLKGASEVIIVADCDTTGLRYSEEVYRSVSAVAKAKVVCSPVQKDGADFSDHRDYGFGLDEFETVPFEPIKKRPRMVILVEEDDRAKPVVFNGFSQESVERSLVGSMMKYGHSYGIGEIDITTDPRLKVIVKAVAKLGAREFIITPEAVAVEIEESGVSTYDKVIGYALELEGVAFDDTAKPLVAARILRERTMRSGIARWLTAAQRRAVDERIDLEDLMREMRQDVDRHAGEFSDLDAYCQPVGDVFAVDVLEEIILEEIEQPAPTNVREIRSQRKGVVYQKAGQGG